MKHVWVHQNSASPGSVDTARRGCAPRRVGTCSSSSHVGCAVGRGLRLPPPTAIQSSRSVRKPCGGKGGLLWLWILKRNAPKGPTTSSHPHLHRHTAQDGFRRRRAEPAFTIGKVCAHRCMTSGASAVRPLVRRSGPPKLKRPIALLPRPALNTGSICGIVAPLARAGRPRQK
jgi:hypothetical protein